MSQEQLINNFKLNSTFIIHGKVDGKDRQGTCFAINENEVMTAWHVVNNMEDIRVSLTSDDFACDIYSKLNLIKHDEKLDIAILSVEKILFLESINTGNERSTLKLSVQVCGYPLEKAGKHAILDTTISNLYDDINTENLSFEINQTSTVDNYRGMSGSPILINGYVIGVLLVQQGGSSLYCVSISDVFKQNPMIRQHFNICQTSPIKHILFNHYTKLIEPFYYERTEDREFIKSLNVNNVWVFGKSGVGKTAIINRNLTKNNIDYCYCDFSPIEIKNEYDVLDEILECIEDKFGGKRLSTETNKIKQINRILCEAEIPKVIVVIDELGVDEDEVLKKIADTLMKLVSYVTHNYQEDGLMFAVSTINSPTGLLKNSDKANDYFQFLCCDSWEDSLSELFDLICLNLQVEIQFMKSEIIENSKKSPRILKSIIKNIVSLEAINRDAISKAIFKTLNEAVI